MTDDVHTGLLDLNSHSQQHYLGPQELLQDQINRGDRGPRDLFLASLEMACHCCWPDQAPTNTKRITAEERSTGESRIRIKTGSYTLPGWVTVHCPALVLAAADWFSCLENPDR